MNHFNVPEFVQMFGIYALERDLLPALALQPEIGAWEITWPEMAVAGFLCTRVLVGLPRPTTSAACGGNCLQLVNGTNLVEGTKEAFPGVKDGDFATYIPEMSGHGLNSHLNTPEIYDEIQKWFASVA